MVLGGLNERYNRMEEATMTAAKKGRACLVNEGRGPQLPMSEVN